MYKNTIIMWLLVVLSYIYFGCQSDSQPDERSNEEALTAAEESNTLSICSFNIQFLGHFKKKDDTALASILKDYNIEVVQELVAPPRDGNYPDGETYSTDTESVEFFKAMQNLGSKTSFQKRILVQTMKFIQALHRLNGGQHSLSQTRW